MAGGVGLAQAGAGGRGGGGERCGLPRELLSTSSRSRSRAHTTESFLQVVNTSIPKEADLSTLQFFAVRTGRVAVANLPVLFLSAGRHNLVTWLTGVPYQTVRTYHKVTGLACFVETLLHTFT